jgi:mRNA degradation ribonuclease J1/J2
VKTKVQAHIERFHLSGHADRDELLQFALQTEARSIVLTHGETAARAWFAQQLTEKMPEDQGDRSDSRQTVSGSTRGRSREAAGRLRRHHAAGRDFALPVPAPRPGTAPSRSSRARFRSTPSR